MCGITGIAAPAARRYAAPLARMTAALSHRGPDADGVHFFDNCGFGHRRLSIIDLSTGQQPMLEAGGQVGLTFNGEIYGYQAIRAACDYPFQTSSDTEVLLALYAQHGDRFVAKLPGMFAFALWDDRRQRLICGRDRFGEKPFFYAWTADGAFVFASEIKAILASGLIDPEIDPQAVAAYMQRFYVPPDRTIYRNIHTLPPAHMLTLSGGRLELSRYWRLPEPQRDLPMGAAVEQLRHLLDQAVARQLIADVPVGAFLSGGLDSSTIVALASRHTERIKTFSFGFLNGTNELPFARAVARQYGTEHHELVDETTDVGSLLLTMQQVYDQPFADTSNIPTYLISRFAGEHVKVVLTGDGGDELLAGYAAWYQPLRQILDVTPARALLLGAVARATHVAYKMRLPVPRRIGEAVQLGYRHRTFTSVAEEHHRRQTRYFAPDLLQQLGLPAASAVDVLARYQRGTLDDALHMDIEQWMAGDILVKIDRASMAHGLELRAPFLDVDLASFCIGLPWRLKIDRQSDKLILRRAFEHLWPDVVRTRGKMGFGVPFDDWFQRPTVKGLAEDYLRRRERRIFDLLDYETCQPLVGQHSIQTWILLNLSLWLESRPASPAAAP